MELEYGRRNYIDSINRQRQQKVNENIDACNDRKKSDLDYEKYLREQQDERTKKLK